MLKSLLSGIRSLVLGDRDGDWDFGDRRNLIRLRCHYDVEFVLRGKKHEGAIVDMGLQGMKLRSFAPLKKGDELSVTYTKEILGSITQTVKCTVAWVRKRERDYVVFAGLIYAEPDEIMARSWVKYLLRELGFQPNCVREKREFVRAECFVPAEVVYGHNKKYEGRMYNLGVGGALVETPGPLEQSGFIELRVGPLEDLERFTISGTVVQTRRQGRLYLNGVRFGELQERHVQALSKYLIFLLSNHWCE